MPLLSSAWLATAWSVMRRLRKQSGCAAPRRSPQWLPDRTALLQLRLVAWLGTIRPTGAPGAAHASCHGASDEPFAIPASARMWDGRLA
eukprot:2284774-Prymnesium_polylepis.1